MSTQRIVWVHERIHLTLCRIQYNTASILSFDIHSFPAVRFDTISNRISVYFKENPNRIAQNQVETFSSQIESLSLNRDLNRIAIWICHQWYLLSLIRKLKCPNTLCSIWSGAIIQVAATAPEIHLGGIIMSF